MRTQARTQNVVSIVPFMTLMLAKNSVNSILVGWCGRPFTPVTGVRLPMGTPKYLLRYQVIAEVTTQTELAILGVDGS